MQVTLLGTGGSSGVPLIGCDCNVCQSKDSKNNRTRVSAFIEINGLHLLIDTSPDLRQQALRHNIRKVDAVLYTHEHADHVHGIDDLRSFNYLADKVLPIYGDKKTLDIIQDHFPYTFLPKPERIWYRPCLVPTILPDLPVGKIDIQGIPIIYYEQKHGKGKALGYRIGNFAYSTDTDALPESSFEQLYGLDLWVVDCLRYTESPSHSNLERTLQWVERVKPKQAVLTHMAHDFDYHTLLAMLPPSIMPGYDGMTFSL